jgi:hypothetical protein
MLGVATFSDCCIWSQALRGECNGVSAVPAGFGPAEASPVLRDFAGRWKGSIEGMHKEVLAQVAEPGCGREVLQVRTSA